MKIIRYILFFLLLINYTVISATESSEVVSEAVDVDIKHIVFDHIGDSYEWHITNIGETEIAIPLPVIVWSKETGLRIFMSSKIHHHHEYDGFYIATEGDYEGKIVYRNAQGEEKRPFDISLTKNAFSLLITSLLLVILILVVARWYKRKDTRKEAPGGFIGFMEMMIMMVHDDVIKSCVGKDYKKFAPYLLTAFFFIFINNLMGLIPIFPGGANVTGNISVTLFMALCTFIAINVFGSKEYWKDIFWPHVPKWLKVPIPVMPMIELFGIFTKPFALMIRLFANITAGHAVVLALTSIVFVTASMGTAVNSGMTVVSVLFGIFMNLLELLVAFIQAYVFTMLSAVFIGMARIEGNTHEEKKCN